LTMIDPRAGLSHAVNGRNPCREMLAYLPTAPSTTSSRAAATGPQAVLPPSKGQSVLPVAIGADSDAGGGAASGGLAAVRVAVAA